MEAAARQIEEVEAEPPEPRHTLSGSSDELGEFAAALAKAQGQFTSARKDSLNPHFKSRYADLASVVDACKAQLSENGIAWVQQPVKADKGWVAILTKLIHKSGQWMSGLTELPVGANTPQAYGSCITYARRYGLCCMAGIVSDEDVDDDGNQATVPVWQKQKAAADRAKPAPAPVPVGQAITRPAPAAVPAAPAPQRAQPQEENPFPPDGPPGPPPEPRPAPRAAAPPPPPEPQRPPPTPAQLRTRALRIWNAKQRQGLTAEGFYTWTASVLGHKRPQPEWTEADLDKLETALARELARG